MLENVSFQTFHVPCTVGDTDVVCIELVELVVVVDDPLNAVVAAKVEAVVVVANVVLIVNTSQGLFATAT